MKNKFLFISLSVIVLVGGFMLSFKLLVKHIYNRRDCERFNIDNIELRTGIDIPKIKTVDCTCDENQGIKSSTFQIDKEFVNIDEYIEKNNFKEEDGLFINSGDNDNTEWKATLIDDSGELVVFIKYKS